MEKKSTFPILIILLISMISSLTSSSFAIEKQIVVINPATGNSDFVFYSNATPVGWRFNASVWVYDVADVFAYQVKLYVNDTLLNITRAWRPTWDPQWIFYGNSTVGTAPAYYDIDHDNSRESVLVGDTLFYGQTPFTGTALLAIIEFAILYQPPTGTVTCPLNITNPDTLLLNSALTQITPITTTNGNYEYIGPAAPPLPTAIVGVYPDRVVNPTLVPCNYFNVNVTVKNATNVYRVDFKLGYDATVLTVENVILGDFFPPSVMPQILINNTIGILLFSVALTPPAPPVSGDGTLVNITFHVEGYGATDLDLYDVGLYDQSDEALPCEGRNGFFTNQIMGKLYVDPHEIRDVRLKPGFIFSVDVVVDDVENLYGYEFKLSYNTQMLTCIAIFIHPIFNETHFRTWMSLDDMLGLLWVKVDYYSPATPITTYAPKAIVTVTFIVENVGSSVLDLFDTSIVNPSQEPIAHEVEDGFVMTLIRDLAVIEVTVSPPWVYEGSLVDITVIVKNKGNLTETFDVKVYYDSNLIGTEKVANLNPNEERALLFIWNTTDVMEGVYTIKGEAVQVPDEFDTTNNVYVDGTVEIRKLIRDIAIVYISAHPNATYSGYPVNITVTVRNEGNLTETFNVIIFYGNDTIGTILVENLASNEVTTFTFVWDTTGRSPCTNYTIKAEVPPIPEEIDIDDNSMVDGNVKIKIMGDIDGDGKVDIKDIATVAAAFGAYPGHERWNPEADLYVDDKVDIRDVAMVSVNFGKVC